MGALMGHGSVTAVVPTVGCPLMAETIRSLLRERQVLARVLVIDNSPTAHATTEVEGMSQRVEVLRPEGNVGYAGAAALGILAAATPYVLLCNDDVELADDALGLLVEAMERDECLGSVGPLILKWSDHSRIDTAGIALSRLFYPSDLLSGERAGRITVGRRLFGVSGCAGLYRREAVLGVGGVRSDLFMYLEDVDLAWRLRSNGWESALVPHARAFHHGSASAGQGSFLKNYYLGRNRWLLWRSNPPLRSFLVRLPVLFVYDSITGLAQALVDRNTGGLRGRAHGIFTRSGASSRAQLQWDSDFRQPFGAHVRRLGRRLVARRRRAVTTTTAQRSSLDQGA